MSAALTLAGVAAGIGAGALGLRRLLHEAILRGLRAPREPHERPIESMALPGGRIERLAVRTEGGRRLAAWLATPACSEARPLPLVATVHGWGSNASALWPAVPALVDAGHAVLLFDARCHGESDDEPFTSMPRFAEDLAAALRHVLGDPRVDPARVALLGHSVGAGAALLLASRSAAALPLTNPPRPPMRPALPPIRAVVSLSAFAHPHEMMRRFLAEHRVPYPVLGWYVLRHVQNVIGARFDDIAPVRSIASVRCPVLLVHGLQDATVPHADALRLRASASRSELLSVAGDHDLREALAPHLPALLRFLEQALAPAAQGREAITRRDRAPS